MRCNWTNVSYPAGLLKSIQIDSNLPVTCWHPWSFILLIVLNAPNLIVLKAPKTSYFYLILSYVVCRTAYTYMYEKFSNAVALNPVSEYIFKLQCIVDVHYKHNFFEYARPLNLAVKNLLRITHCGSYLRGLWRRRQLHVRTASQKFTRRINFYLSKTNYITSEHSISNL